MSHVQDTWNMLTTHVIYHNKNSGVQVSKLSTQLQNKLNIEQKQF